jgi:hypothetical protein
MITVGRRGPYYPGPVRARGGRLSTARNASSVSERPSVWLALLVGASAPRRAVIAVRMPSPSNFPDEIFYFDLAKSIAAGRMPEKCGE